MPNSDEVILQLPKETDFLKFESIFWRLKNYVECNYKTENERMIFVVNNSEALDEFLFFMSRRSLLVELDETHCYLAEFFGNLIITINALRSHDPNSMLYDHKNLKNITDSCFYFIREYNCRFPLNSEARYYIKHTEA